MSSKTDSYDASELGAFLQSELNARNNDGENVDSTDAGLLFLYSRAAGGASIKRILFSEGFGAHDIGGAGAQLGGDATNYPEEMHYSRVDGVAVTRGGPHGYLAPWYGRDQILGGKSTAGHNFQAGDYDAGPEKFDAATYNLMRCIDKDENNGFYYAGYDTVKPNTGVAGAGHLNEYPTFAVRKYYDNFEQVRTGNWPVTLNEGPYVEPGINADQPDPVHARRLRVLSDGSLIVATNLYQDGNGDWVQFVTIDADGNITGKYPPTWTKSKDTGNPDEDKWGGVIQMEIDPEDNIYVLIGGITGTQTGTFPEPFTDYPVMVKLSSPDSVTWEAVLGSGTSDWPNAVEPTGVTAWRPRSFCLFDNYQKIAISASRSDEQNFFGSGAGTATGDGWTNPYQLHCLGAGGGNILWQKVIRQHSRPNVNWLAHHVIEGVYSNPLESRFFYIKRETLSGTSADGLTASAYSASGSLIWPDKRISSFTTGNGASNAWRGGAVESVELPYAGFHPCDQRIEMPADGWEVTIPGLNGSGGSLDCPICNNLSGFHHFEENPVDDCTWLSSRNPNFVNADDDADCLDLAYGILLYINPRAQDPNSIQGVSGSMQLKFQNLTGTRVGAWYRKLIPGGFSSQQWDRFDRITLFRVGSDLDILPGSHLDICSGWPDTIDLFPRF